MGEILVVGLGGFVGCTLRYLLDKGATTFMPAIPLGTLLVNVIAGLAIGFIIGFEPFSSITQRSRLFIVTGLLGGLSTFSAFSAETVLLFENGQYLHSGLNVLTNVGFSLIAVVIGLFIARTLSGAVK